MNSSDDDWMSQPPGRGAGAVGGGGEGLDMMAARRQALRQQREAQQRKQQQQPLLDSSSSSQSATEASAAANNRGTRRPPTAGRLGAPAAGTSTTSVEKESSLPAAFLWLDSTDTSTVEEPVTKSKHDKHKKGESTAHKGTEGRTAEVRITKKKKKRPPSPSESSAASTSSRSSSSARSNAEDEEALNAAKIEELKRQVEAKKKLLQATRERERALTDKWRADKAQKQAEIHQLDAKLRNVWATVEDEKSAAESQVRLAQDEHEREMRQARQRLEQELKAEYEPKITEMQEKLKEKREEEAHLRNLLQAKGETQDVVNAAIASALSAIVSQIQTTFLAGQEAQDNEWHSHVRDLVRHEVRTSFAVGTESEAQTEREAMTKHFHESLAFWREAEEDLKRRALKLDDALLADMESTVREDMGRLQREQLSMEEVYVQSREAWALEHQRLLQAEFDASLRRREAELEEFRKLRHELHVERMRDLEQSHSDRVAAEEALHEAAMQQLREYLGKEELLHAERQRVTVATRQEVVRSVESLKDAASACEGVLTSLKGFQSAVVESRESLEAERRRQAEQQAGALESLQSFAVKQAGSIEEEHRALTEALSKLQLVQTQVEQQLEAEATWLAQQEGAYEGSRGAWEREYRQWKALVQRERAEVEARFSQALSALQEAIGQLNAEERDVTAESAAMERAYTDMNTAVQQELVALQEKEAELKVRQTALDEAVASLEGKQQEATEEWQELQRQRADMAQERETLRREEGKLEQTAHTLQSLRAQMESAKAQTTIATERGRLLQEQLAMRLNMAPESSGALTVAGLGQERGSLRPPHHDQQQQRQGQGHTMDTSVTKHRLAQKVLTELKRQLHGVNKLSELPLSAGGAPTLTPVVSSNVAQLIYGQGPGTDTREGPASQPQLRHQRREQHPGRHAVSSSSPEDEYPVTRPRHHADPNSRTQPAARGYVSGGTPRSPASPTAMLSHQVRTASAAGRGTGYASGQSPSPQQQEQPLRTSSEWSAVGGQTFTNLVGLSDADSPY